MRLGLKGDMQDVFQANIYPFKVFIETLERSCKICSQLTIKILERCK